MKNRIKFTALIAALLLVNAASAQRNTLWMRGVSQTSHGWNGTENYFEYLGYDFQNYVFSNVYQPGLGVEAAADAVAESIENYDDLLGIAHDYGGLVMRDLQHKSDNVSAMVLVGTPNQGSSAIDFATIIEPNANGTRAQILVDAIQDIKGGDRCDDCDLVGAFDSWITGLYGGREYLSDAGTGSEVLLDLNANMPTVPFAVMWGSVEDFSITRLMSSRAFPSDGDYYTDCYADRLEMARQKAMKDFYYTTIRNTTGFLGGVLNFIGAVSPSLDLDNLISRIGSFINSQRQNFITEFEAVRERDEELARILRCEFANQLLAAEWQIALLENSSLEETEVTINIPSEYDECMIGCATDMAWGDWGMNLTCEEFCAGLPDDETITATALVPELNDGLLTRSEQLLDGAVKTYHLEETNHFQESRAGLKPVVSDAFEDLFEGSAGDAFRIPKQ
ncbi:MAG: hypothetical protein H6560_23385 [Lewinellaceae bacterium]|nr:hypothetical protein [Lewinellaceae bacterium]